MILFIETPVFTKQANGELFTDEAIFLLLAYPTSKKDNLSKAELEILKQLIRD